MKIYDVKCPICGAINHNLYLEDSGGFMECEQCRRIVKGIPIKEEALGVTADNDERAHITVQKTGSQSI